MRQYILIAFYNFYPFFRVFMLYKLRRKNFTLYFRGSNTLYHRIFADFVSYRQSVISVIIKINLKSY